MNNTTILPQSTHNGIDTKRQSQTIEAIGKNPAAGEVRLRATNRWQGGTRTQSRITAFAAAGGHHQHVKEFAVDTPTEHALQALAACMTTTMIYNCAARGIEVRSVESEVQGEMNAAGFFKSTKPSAKDFQKSPPSAPVQRRLQGPPAKSNFLGACRTLSRPENLVVSIHARTICLR
jgi:uncharacterized OsmC-like protein